MAGGGAAKTEKGGFLKRVKEEKQKEEAQEVAASKAKAKKEPKTERPKADPSKANAGESLSVTPALSGRRSPALSGRRSPISKLEGRKCSTPDQ